MPRLSPTAPSDRQRTILRLAREAGRLEVTPTAQRLGVSPETLRRDVRALEKRGVIRRSYGAIVPTDAGRFERELSHKRLADMDEKEAITRGAMTLIDDATTVFFDDGLLPELMVPHIPVDRSLTVVTRSLAVASAVARQGVHEVLMVGGRVRRKTLGTQDHWVERMLSSLVIDVAFLGTDGISYVHGLTTPDPAVAAAKHAAIRASRRRVLVSEHTKLGVTSFARFAGLEDMHQLVTGRRLSSSAASRIAEHGTRVVRF